MFNWMIAGGFFVLGIAVDSIARHKIKGYMEHQRDARQIQEEEILKRAERLQISSMEEEREKLARIRHDFNNQLVTAYRLVELGESTRSRELLDGVRSQVAECRGFEYCENAIVNAVFMEKAPLCQEKDIAMYVDLDVPGETKIRPVHLCSVFSNLLDNAILAAQECGKDQRFLKVKASGKGDYFLVKVENSALEKRQDRQKGKKRYGQDILREIADIYKGEFWTQWENGVYTACISMLVERS